MSLVRKRGHRNFRQRLVCATLGGRPLRIDAIREDAEEPGLRDYEASFLRLLDKLSNGMRLEINETGTSVRYYPGIVHGGRVEHDCGTVKSIPWFLEALLPLCLFSKRPVQLSLEGVTNAPDDLSIDAVQGVLLPLLKRFGVEAGVDMKVKRRGAPPNGGGLVLLRLPVVRELQAVEMLDPGFVKRVRGTAYAARVSPQTPNRVVEAARALLNRLLPDVYIYSDHVTGPDSGKSPGFGLCLIAETTEGFLYSSDAVAERATLPEDLGDLASRLLCEEMVSGGCVDSVAQPLALMLMALCPEDVSRVRLGRLTPYSVAMLRVMRDLLGITFKLRTDAATGTVVASCLGLGFKNTARAAT